MPAKSAGVHTPQRLNSFSTLAAAGISSSAAVPQECDCRILRPVRWTQAISNPCPAKFFHRQPRPRPVASRGQRFRARICSYWATPVIRTRIQINKRICTCLFLDGFNASLARRRHGMEFKIMTFMGVQSGNHTLGSGVHADQAHATSISSS